MCQVGTPEAQGYEPVSGYPAPEAPGKAQPEPCETRGRHLPQSLPALAMLCERRRVEMRPTSSVMEAYCSGGEASQRSGFRVDMHG